MDNETKELLERFDTFMGIQAAFKEMEEEFTEDVLEAFGFKPK